MRSGSLTNDITTPKSLAFSDRPRQRRIALSGGRRNAVLRAGQGLVTGLILKKVERHSHLSRPPFSSRYKTTPSAAEQTPAACPPFFPCQVEEFLRGHAAHAAAGDARKRRLDRCRYRRDRIDAAVLPSDLDLSVARGIFEDLCQSLPRCRIRIELHISSSTRDKPIFRALLLTTLSSASNR
jgi:hypothetical protein